MAPFVWGLDLAEIKWSKFKSSYMWNREYHLRRTKFIVYQLALIFCVCSESLGTAALSDYIDQQDYIQRVAGAYNYNNDYVGVASYNIFAGVFNAFIFGAAFFFDLFWAERRESPGVRIAWKACAVLSVLFVGASAFALTIVTARNRSYVAGLSDQAADQLSGSFTKDGGAPLQYRHNGRAVAAVVFIWPGLMATLASCALLFISIDHNEALGPKSRHARERDAREGKTADPEANILGLAEKVGSQHPEQSHPRMHTASQEDRAARPSSILAHPSPSSVAEGSDPPDSLKPEEDPADSRTGASTEDVSLIGIEETQLSSEAPSDFSSLAVDARKKKKTSEESGRSVRSGRTLGEMSIAKLTSGLADGGWNSR